jgi:exopolyphosphatase/guanosine-5'-triphosphate,3'-diphosphate pyrophosphatase
VNTSQKHNPNEYPVRIALFDIGTNSIKLLIAEATTGSAARNLFFSRATTRLGAGIEHGGRIRRQALDNTMQSISRLQQKISEYSCKKTFAFATHALRAAVNAQSAVKMIEQQAGIHLRILTGEEEAFYAFTSARNRVALKKPHTILIDIGGGSTEFVFADKFRIRNLNSLPLGAIRLTENFLRSDPVTSEEYRAMEQTIEHTVKQSRILDSVHIEGSSALDLVVSGGAIWTLAQIIYHTEGYPQHSTRSNKIKRAQLQSILNKCLALTVNERKQIEGLEPDRADIIVAGLAIVLTFMRVTNKRVFIANEGGVREGVLHAIIQNDFRWPEQTDPTERCPGEGPRS